MEKWNREAKKWEVAAQYRASIIKNKKELELFAGSAGVQ